MKRGHLPIINQLWPEKRADVVFFWFLEVTGHEVLRPYSGDLVISLILHSLHVYIRVGSHVLGAEGLVSSA